MLFEHMRRTRMSIKAWHFGLSRDNSWNYLGFRKKFNSWHVGLSRDKPDRESVFSFFFFRSACWRKPLKQLRFSSLVGPGTHLKRCASTRAFICAKKASKYAIGVDVEASYCFERIVRLDDIWISTFWYKTCNMLIHQSSFKAPKTLFHLLL